MGRSPEQSGGFNESPDVASMLDEEFVSYLETFRNPLQSYIAGLGNGKNINLDPELIAQDSIAKAWEKRAQFRGESTFYLWLRTIAHNEFIAACRREKTRSFVTRSYDAVVKGDVLGGNYGVEINESARCLNKLDPNFDQVAFRAELDTLMKALNKNEVELLHLKYVKGHTTEEMAKMLNVGENTLKVQIFRARQKMLELAKRNQDAVKIRKKKLR